MPLTRTDEIIDSAYRDGVGVGAFNVVQLEHAEAIVTGAEKAEMPAMAATRDITAYCHDSSAWVEAELGEVGGKDGAHAPGVRTDPGEARAFAGATHVDVLAVAVGSSHAMLSRDAVLDFALIAQLREAVSVPLVLHGSPGVADSGLRTAVVSGMTKVNVSTHLNRIFTRTVRDGLCRP